MAVNFCAFARRNSLVQLATSYNRHRFRQARTQVGQHPSSFEMGTFDCVLGPMKCVNQPCRNGGSCFSNGNSYYCYCAANYSGMNCELVKAASSSSRNTVLSLSTNYTRVFPSLREKPVHWIADLVRVYPLAMPKHPLHVCATV